LLAVKLDAATKEDYLWGLRIGFMTFSAPTPSKQLHWALERKTGGAIRGNISNCSHLSQAVLLRAMQNERYEKEKEERFAVMRARAAKVKQVLAQDRYSSVWTPYPFNSGYFMCLELRGICAEQFRLRLLEEHGIGVIATGKNDIRVAFSCIEEQDIPELFELMFTCARDMNPT
jgi:aspartate/methionine/tyrosine aminotransferase